MQKKIVLFAVTMAVIAAAVIHLPVSDAGIEQDDTYYCYGDHPNLVPKFINEEVEWSVVYDDGTTTTPDVDPKTGVATVDLTGHSTAVVTQEVGNDIARATLIALHLGSGEYIVTFYDRGAVCGDQIVDGTKVVEKGQPHVYPPTVSDREGYDFGGWFTTSTFEVGTEFDPSEPITGNTNVYAKWSPVTSGGTTGSINVGSHIVTFNCSPGLTYTLLDSGNGRVSFTVSELPDYQVIEGSIEVEANGNPISPVDGVYTVTGINTDVLITIDGDLMFSGNPNDPASDDGGMPMWMWIMLVVVILLIAAAILWMRGRQVDQGRI